jgi:uncharacterized protein (DUF952 family)
MIIYHIVLPEIWEKFKNEKFYEAESLQTEGFIHCSFAKQIETVLNRYYKNAERVLLLEIETEKLTSELINEPSTGGEVYPHIYGNINAEAIVGNKEKTIDRG